MFDEEGRNVTFFNFDRERRFVVQVDLVKEFDGAGRRINQHVGKVRGLARFEREGRGEVDDRQDAVDDVFADQGAGFVNREEDFAFDADVTGRSDAFVHNIGTRNQTFDRQRAVFIASVGTDVKIGVFARVIDVEFSARDRDAEFVDLLEGQRAGDAGRFLEHNFGFDVNFVFFAFNAAGDADEGLRNVATALRFVEINAGREGLETGDDRFNGLPGLGFDGPVVGGATGFDRAGVDEFVVDENAESDFVAFGNRAVHRDLNRDVVAVFFFLNRNGVDDFKFRNDKFLIRAVLQIVFRRGLAFGFQVIAQTVDASADFFVNQEHAFAERGKFSVQFARKFVHRRAPLRVLRNVERAAVAIIDAVGEEPNRGLNAGDDFGAGQLGGAFETFGGELRFHRVHRNVRIGVRQNRANRGGVFGGVIGAVFQVDAFVRDAVVVTGFGVAAVADFVVAGTGNVKAVRRPSPGFGRRSQNERLRNIVGRAVRRNHMAAHFVSVRRLLVNRLERITVDFVNRRGNSIAVPDGRGLRLRVLSLRRRAERESERATQEKFHRGFH